jgi:hypothetical protein
VQVSLHGWWAWPSVADEQGAPRPPVPLRHRALSPFVSLSALTPQAMEDVAGTTASQIHHNPLHRASMLYMLVISAAVAFAAYGEASPNASWYAIELPRMCAVAASEAGLARISTDGDLDGATSLHARVHGTKLASTC